MRSEFNYKPCNFSVGGGQLLAGHKLILAMASPVFEAMFYGGLAEKNDPIEILDVQAEAFKALLEYIYTDKININTVDKAFELCYAAKKYMVSLRKKLVRMIPKQLPLVATFRCRAVYDFFME